ncbi:hypothetical protein HDU96_000048 [Phlyctochytrium bullatum]|nr:hypothetical protein HDU96_000048 [Phlyctochytrium bullatum]
MLATAGVEIDDVHNGVLLCLTRRGLFYDLQLYLDVDAKHEGRKRFLGKVDPISTSIYPWNESVSDFKECRERKRKRSVYVPQVDWAQRHVEDATGELEMYFTRESDPDEYPNELALRLHKSACLMCRMAIDFVEDPELPSRPTADV